MNKNPFGMSAVKHAARSIRFTTAGCLVLIALIFAPAVSRAQTGLVPKQNNEGTMVRMLCVQTLSENKQKEEAIIATKTKDGEWYEISRTLLRTPFVTDWINVPSGTIYLVRREGEKMVPLGSFVTTAGMSRAILILLPDPGKGIYKIDMVNPDKLQFREGKALIINYGEVTALVKLGEKQKVVKPGQRVIADIVPGADTMYRILVGSVEEGKILACYETYTSFFEGSRRFLLLFPGSNTKLNVFSMPDFGPFQ